MLETCLGVVAVEVQGVSHKGGFKAEVITLFSFKTLLFLLMAHLVVIRATLLNQHNANHHTFSQLLLLILIHQRRDQVMQLASNHPKESKKVNHH